jgi:hypothetical protein
VRECFEREFFETISFPFPQFETTMYSIPGKFQIRPFWWQLVRIGKMGELGGKAAQLTHFSGTSP